MSESSITIIDYGVGNLSSLRKVFSFFGIEPRVSEEAEAIRHSRALVLPGVGSFEAGMRGLTVRGLKEAVKEFASENRPILGICLGAQLLLSEGHEFGVFEGLAIIPGRVVRFSALDDNDKIPHVGWNRVSAPREKSWDNTIFSSLRKHFDVYFVHSYILVPDNSSNVWGLTSYGGKEFCSVVRQGNVYGCQFHPEKSGEAGLEIIRNFIHLAYL